MKNKQFKVIFIFAFLFFSSCDYFSVEEKIENLQIELSSLQNELKLYNDSLHEINDSIHYYKRLPTDFDEIKKENQYLKKMVKENKKIFPIDDCTFFDKQSGIVYDNAAELIMDIIDLNEFCDYCKNEKQI